MEKRQFNTIVDGGAKKVKVLFSHENKRIHSAIVPVLRDFLSHELGRDVEIVSGYTAKATLYYATDNVFDLIILADSYPQNDLSANELVKQIKKLDQSIPIVQFFSPQTEGKRLVDAVIGIPKSKQDFRPLTHLFRDGDRFRKRG